MKTLIILMFMAILIGFMFQVFVLYSTANTVSTSVQRSIMTVAAVNMPSLFGSIREGSAETNDSTQLVTIDELRGDIAEELGLVQTNTQLVKESSAGGWYYRINDLAIKAENVEALATVKYSADFVLEVPVAKYWNFGSFKIPMHVEAKYTAKY